MRWILAVLALFAIMASPAQAQQSVLDRALADAARTLARAMPKLNAVELGIPMASYKKALTRRLVRFNGATANAPISFVFAREGEGSCDRFVAYVRGPGAAMYLCPKFFSRGADAQRETTILHEMVHIVAGPDECLAMAFTARVQFVASGTFQPVAQYWAANGCPQSKYALPQ
ncbi:hypothetical protein [Devosia sp.]|uniref:hypothetical protein n=1 Tax=Devosia sp. TaxID=1871048 RepID=UPI00326756B2